MSSILKALRKLEDEKGDMGEGSVDLARDILKRSYPQRRVATQWWGLAVVAVFFLLGIGWFFLDRLVVETPLPLAAGKVVEDAASVPAGLLPSIPQPQAAVQVFKPKPDHVSAAPKVVAPSGEGATAKEAALAIADPLVIPDLSIEEIVYTADPGARLAVINDLPVMQGTDIEGVRVVEILPDRVRFEYRGIYFDKFGVSAN